MSDTTGQTELEARVAWLERELARIVAKVDQSISMGPALDTPTPSQVVAVRVG